MPCPSDKLPSPVAPSYFFRDIPSTITMKAPYFPIEMYLPPKDFPIPTTMIGQLLFYPFTDKLPAKLAPSYFSEMFSGALPKITGVRKNTKRKHSELILMSPPTKKIKTYHHDDNEHTVFLQKMQEHYLSNFRLGYRILEHAKNKSLLILFPFPQAIFQEAHLTSILNQHPTTMIPSAFLDVIVDDHEGSKPPEPSPPSATSESASSLYLRILFQGNTALSVPLLSAFLRPLGPTLLVVPPRGDCPLDGFPTTPIAPILLINHPRKQRTNPGCPFGGQGIG